MSLTVSAPTFEHVPGALGLGTATPRVSWKTEAEPSWTQAAYELRVVRRGGVQTFRVETNESVLVSWPDVALESRERADVQVRVHGHDGTVSGWSDAMPVETGLLTPEDWTAQLVGPSWTETDADDRRPPIVRRDFTLDKAIARARLYATAHGLYEVEINGQRVGDDALSPGWTVYGSRLRYYTYDVTELLQNGSNAIGAWLGDGWYRGRYGFVEHQRNLYGDDIGLIAQLEIEFQDGTRHTLNSDAAWRATPSPILASGLYNGESYDAEQFQPGWSSPGFDDAAWRPVTVRDVDAATLVAPDGPPVRCTQEIAPVTTIVRADGILLLDFGQNFSGRLRLRGSGAKPGTRISIRHAEVLVNDEIYVRTLRLAKATDQYLSPDGSVDWEPRFTIHGFRYAEITGWDGPVEDLEATGRVYHTDMPRTGWFQSSDAQLNRLHENVVWSARSNFVDIPTDCPQRDERLGWTGDLQVFAPTASYLFDVSGMLSSWLKDVAVEQRIHGTVPWYVPVIPGNDSWTPVRPGAVWGDVAVLTPWVLYENFGDVELLREQYASAKAWIDQIDELAGPSHLWNSGFQLGDWLDPTAPPESPADARTDKYLVATAYFAWSTLHLSKIAEALGIDRDKAAYAGLADAIREAFRREYLSAPGTLVNDAETAYSLAIVFGLLDAEELPIAGRHLNRLVAERNNTMGAGFAGVNVISDALTNTGFVGRAYDLLFAQETPSWMSMVNKGATTIWERWDSMLDTGEVNPGEMTSFNHYALGSVADWMHRVVGGVEALAPGFRKVRVSPTPGGGLTFARTTHESPYGTISCTWHIEDGEMKLEVQLPTGVSAEVTEGNGNFTTVGPGQHRFSIPVTSRQQSGHEA